MEKLRANLMLGGILCLLVVIGVSVSAFGQEKATLTGTVTDSDNGSPLPGANVLVTSSNVQTGAATNTSGEYTVRNIPAGAYTVTISYIGYEKSVTANVVLSAGETKTHDVSLVLSSIEINPIVATASRRPEKTLDAPASISVIELREISQDVSTSSSSILRNVTGVDVSQTGVDRREIVMRGFNNAFSGEAYVLTDNRQSAIASLGVNVHSIMPNQSTDLDRVEIVRGPGAALYGPGVDEGVIHYITKDPFAYPGTTVSFSGGERSAFAAQFRHAGVAGAKVGYKITGQYAQANDWELDPSDPLDAFQLALDRPGVARDYDYKKLNINGMLQFRLSDDVTLTANAGFASLNAVVLTGVGTSQADGFGYKYGQIRLQAGNFFAQTYLNVNDLGDSFLYARTSGLTDLVDKSKLWNIQAQYNLETWNEKQLFIFGFDYDRTTPDTKGTIIGRFEDKDLISETGAYIQSQTALSEKFDVTLALRGDYNNLKEDFILSPRVAAVLKPTPQHSFRASFNRAFTSPGVTENFLDIQVGSNPRFPNDPMPINVRGLGSAFGYTFARNPAFAQVVNSDLVAYSIAPGNEGAPQPVGLPLGATYEAVYAQLSALPISTIRALLPPPLNDPNAVPDAVIMQFIGLLDPTVTQVQGFSSGVLALPNLTTGGVEIIQDVTNIKPLDINTTTTFEVGYKGLIENRVLFAVDAYYTKKQDFVGPLLVESPLVLVPTLGTDLNAALTTGISDNPQLAGLLAQVGFTPQQVADIIVGLASASPGTPLNDPTLPVAIVAPVENAPAPGQTPEIMLAYRNFGEVNFWGIDASVQVLATERLSLFGNVSIVSDDFFDNKELGETNTALAVALNAPSFKTKFGFSYNKPFGISFNGSARYVKGFPVESGPYVGDVDDYFLIDIGAGYDLGRVAPGARIDFAIQNVLDNSHREFIGAPEIGRFGMIRFTYTR